MVDPVEVQEACAKVKKPRKLSATGVCVKAVEWCGVVHKPLAKLVGDTLSDDSMW